MRIPLPLLALTLIGLPSLTHAGKLPPELAPEAMTGSYVAPEAGPECIETQKESPDTHSPYCMTADKLEGLTERVVTDAIEQRERPGIPPAISPPGSLPEPPMTPLQQHIKDLIGR